ncbi:SIMPL domain-containing protein [Halostreptopolyspora alba]|uniref:SIMPL domain-containing protein n=1 Tax=Halostreptopolyspora alba TaxID=2487137 RepID=A0A3N0DR22_9ACTN|nr:SIMPL domain-containing protein [Nocardiopsaceae bacterium YIM 96095]
MSEPTPSTSRSAPIVRVRGSATLEVEPELARFTVEVGAQAKDRRLTLERLTNRNDTIRERIQEFGEAVTEMSSSALRVRPVLRDRRNERVSNYHGHVRLHAAMSDFDALGGLLPELANQELTEVRGPWWRLRTDSPVYARARSQAAREAVERARVYAEALGARLTGLVELADVGLSSEHANTHVREMSASYGDAPGAPPAPGGARSAGATDTSPAPLNLEPEQIEVSARLEATFTMSQPDEL